MGGYRIPAFKLGIYLSNIYLYIILRGSHNVTVRSLNNSRVGIYHARLVIKI